MFLCEACLRRNELAETEQFAKRVLELPFPQEVQLASAHLRDIMAARRQQGHAVGAHAAALAEALQSEDSGMDDSDMQSAGSALGLTGDSTDLDLTGVRPRSLLSPSSASGAGATAAAADAAAFSANNSDMSSIGLADTQSHIFGNSTLPSLPGSAYRPSQGGRRRSRDEEASPAIDQGGVDGLSGRRSLVGVGVNVSHVRSPGGDSVMSSSTLSSHKSERGRGL